jgi:hypothetical protein
MRRMPSSAHRIHTRRSRPVIEGLEDRRLLSHASLGRSISTAAISSGGVFSHHGTQFSYTTPTGGRAVIHVVGLGNLAGTNVDSAGDLNLVYGGTNAFSKILSRVTGGSGRAPLASILNSQLIAAGAQNSLTGVGGNVIDSVYLGNFDLIAGGNINLTSGVNTLVLDSVGPNTQIHLRDLPPPPSSTTTTTSTLGVVSTLSGTTTGAAVRSTVTTTSPSSTTLQAGQSATITNEGVSASYQVGPHGAQTLTSISGTFTPGSNIVEPLPTGTPGQTPRPAPPGVILKVNQIEGNSTAAVNLLTDPKIFGYDPTTGDVVRFDVNLTNDTGTIDSTFTPISVPGDPAAVGLNLGWNGNQLNVLVSSGTTIFAYNATTGAAVGSFTASEPINSIASTDTVTVLGSYATNQLQMINLPLSLQTGVVQPATGNPQPFTPAAGFTLLGGLTGLPGSSSVTATVAATFNTFQPTQLQLGLQSINTTSVSVHKKSAKFSYRFSGGTASAVTEGGAFTPVTPNLPSPTTPGAALGSIDQSTALVTGLSNGANTISLGSGGTLTLTYPDQLVALSEAFRPDLASSALIDVQGDVQSIRGGSANGAVINDNGNLNLVQFNSVTNSTIIGQPVGHLNITTRSNTTVLTPSRTINGSNGSFTNDGRNDVTVDKNLNPIGPLSQTGD